MQRQRRQGLSQSKTEERGPPLARPLTAEILRLESVPSQTVDEMYGLFATGYEDTNEAIFRRDLSGKTHLLLLRDAAGGLCGFTTAVVWEFANGEDQIRLLFSGDTMVDPRIWGDRTFLTAWLEMAGAAYASDIHAPLYWLLLSKGHRTFRTLPLFFRRYYPSEVSEPALAAIADRVGAKLFADRFDRSRRLVVGGPLTGRLQPELARVPDKDRRRAEVNFFLAQNPSYASGDEIICLAPLQPDNIRESLRRYFLRGLEKEGIFGEFAEGAL